MRVRHPKISQSPQPLVLLLLLYYISELEHAEFTASLVHSKHDRLLNCIPSILAKGWAYTVCKASLPLPAELSFDGENNLAPRSQEEKKTEVVFLKSN